MKTLAYASTTRPNHLWSAAQFNSADQKNRTECDILLISKADAETALAAKDAEIAKLREALDECEDYFDNRADADCDQDGFIPNKEMELLHVVRTALKGGTDAKM